MEGQTCCKHGVMHWVVKILVIVGGLNWGLYAIDPNWNVVNKLLGQWPQVERGVYGLVGLAALWMLVKTFMHCCNKKQA